MRTNIRGEIAIELGGRRIILRPSLACLLRIEDQLDMSLPDIALTFAKLSPGKDGLPGKTPKTQFILRIIYACFLEREPNLTWDQFLENLWSKADINQLILAATQLIFACMSCGKAIETGEEKAEVQKLPSAPAEESQRQEEETAL